MLAISGAVLAGCETLGLDNRPPEEIVAQRAQAWADALLEGNLKRAYKYTSPNYRKFATLGRYNARVEGTSRWDTAQVDRVECETEACTVTFYLEYDAPHMKVQIRRPREYRWVRVENRWWLYVPPK